MKRVFNGAVVSVSVAGLALCQPAWAGVGVVSYR